MTDQFQRIQVNHHCRGGGGGDKNLNCVGEENGKERTKVFESLLHLHDHFAK